MADASTARTGHLHIHETSLGVWEEPPGPARTEDMEPVLDHVLEFLRSRDFQVWRDPHTEKHYKSLARWSWLARKGDLEADVQLRGRHLQVEFFQELNVSNPNGGRYDFQKFHRMPRHMQLQCIAEMHLLTQALLSIGYVYSYRGRERQVSSALDVRDLMNPTRRWGTLEDFNDSWNSEHDWKRGGRFERDDTGWPTAREIGVRKDRDGVPIRNGETRYTYYRGNLVRGVVRPNMNGMWCIGGITYVPSGDLFLCDPSVTPRRDPCVHQRRVRQELEAALKREDFRRVYVLAGVLAREEAVDGSA